MESAPGGAIIEPKPGFHVNVLLFDFKSLYPTIMRTFNIDPIGYISPQKETGVEEQEESISAPNGARFERGSAILPEILAEFFLNREEAKKRGDEIASHVYKIIMNSFYGVLGTSGCRFAASDIAGAITSFGQYFLNWTESRFRDAGFSVIYGDTDSLFVLGGDKEDIESLRGIGKSLATSINEELNRHITETWDLTSYLELEFEAIYRRLFLPPLRGSAHLRDDRSDGEGEPRGRAKGYAGLRITAKTGESEETLFEIKGMEAVRRDWTEAAQRFQITLLTKIFAGESKDDIRGYVRDQIDGLYAGELDDGLIYRKGLRKPVASYTKNKPPHVRAAELLGRENQRGVIKYVWSTEGPQPVQKRSSPLDYDHYLDKQLKPIAETISAALDYDLGTLFGEDSQTSLF